MLDNSTIITQTKKWLYEVVIGLNFCPFAFREFKLGTIHYEIVRNADRQTSLEAIQAMIELLDKDEKIETILLIFPDDYETFNSYLRLVDRAEIFIEEHSYEGIYQIATFHPEYIFAGVKPNDAANYTNRAPYPMLHFLREASLNRVLEHYPNPDKIPSNNIHLAREKGLEQMQALLKSCLDIL